MAMIAIAGAGNVAFTCACHLASIGQAATVWAPGGNGTRGLEGVVDITSRGFLNGVFPVHIAQTPQDLVAASDLVLIAVPAYGHATVIDALLPYLTDDHTLVLMTGQMSLSGLYIAKKLADAGKKTTVVALHGPMTRGRKISQTEYAQVSPNTHAMTAAIPMSDTPKAIARLEQAFGKQFYPAKNGLEVALYHIAGVFHSALALANLSRMESGEIWCGYQNTTESVSNLAESLDKERVAVAEALGLKVPDIITYAGGEAGNSVKEIFQPNSYKEFTRNGPREVGHRYIEEEIPHNLVTLEKLAQKVGVPTPFVTNVIDIFIALRRRNYRQLNTMYSALNGDAMSAEDVLALFENGFRKA